MEYIIDGNKGMAKYIMKAGRDVVMGQMSMDTAERIVRTGEPRNSALPTHPTYCVNVGDYYFLGRWRKPERKQKNIFNE